MSTNLVFIHGRPACGKDTQADLITSILPKATKISGVYRSAFTQRGMYEKYHSLVFPYIKPLGKGINIPGQVVADILEDIVTERSQQDYELFLICGLIRTIDHKRAIEERFCSKNQINLEHIYLATYDSMAIEHAQHRLHDTTKGDENRIDDQVELMQARLERYRKNTIPMLGELHDQRKLKTIRADRPISDVNLDIQMHLARVFGYKELETVSFQERV